MLEHGTSPFATVFPTPDQEILSRRTMGCARLVYNRALAAGTLGSLILRTTKEQVVALKSRQVARLNGKSKDLQFLNGTAVCKIWTPGTCRGVCLTGHLNI